MSSADAGIQKQKIFGLGTTICGNKLDETMNIIRINNDGLSSMMKIIKILENHNILPKGITKTVKNEVKSQRGGFLRMLLGGLASSLLGGILSKGLFGSGMYRKGEGKGIVRAGEGIKAAHPLTNFEIQDYFKNEPRFNDIFSRNNLPKTIKKEPML